MARQEPRLWQRQRRTGSAFGLGGVGEHDQHQHPVIGRRITEIRTAGDFPLLFGGDCSLLMGVGLALRSTEGRFALVHLDGNTDFRNPGNSDSCAALAGEDLAEGLGRLGAERQPRIRSLTRASSRGRTG